MQLQGTIMQGTIIILLLWLVLLLAILVPGLPITALIVLGSV